MESNKNNDEMDTKNNNNNKIDNEFVGNDSKEGTMTITDQMAQIDLLDTNRASGSSSSPVHELESNAAKKECRYSISAGAESAGDGPNSTEQGDAIPEDSLLPEEDYEDEEMQYYRIGQGGDPGPDKRNNQSNNDDEQMYSWSGDFKPHDDSIDSYDSYFEEDFNINDEFDEMF